MDMDMGMDMKMDQAGADTSTNDSAMAPMAMTFFTSTTTPLYTSAWTPTTAPQYALACIFLIVLCLVFRCLLAARCNLPKLLARTRSKKHKRKTSDWTPSYCAEVEENADGDLFEKTRSVRFEGESETPIKSGKGNRIAEVLIRAVLDTLLCVVSYLLMLAIMTYNTGYFLSVVAGTFAGSVLLGGHTDAAGH